MQKLITLHTAPMVSFLIAGLVAAASLGPSVWDPSGHSNQVFQVSRALAPQGWSFFTRSPREDYFALFEENSDEVWRKFEPIGRRTASPLTNFDRSWRANASAVDELMANIHPELESRQLCGDRVEQCRSLAEDLKVQKFRFSNPRVCGQFLLVKTAVKPWSYRKLSGNSNAEVALIEVEC